MKSHQQRPGSRREFLGNDEESMDGLGIDIFVDHTESIKLVKDFQRVAPLFCWVNGVRLHCAVAGNGLLWSGGETFELLCKDVLGR